MLKKQLHFFSTFDDFWIFIFFFYILVQDKLVQYKLISLQKTTISIYMLLFQFICSSFQWPLMHINADNTADDADVDHHDYYDDDYDDILSWTVGVIVDFMLQPQFLSC